eukprot:TRINITY_DN10124_c0_g1_i18.p1 TRINITY_DN10124_c0_g1~~TRINITY_DN10124_c0_g1_i18.p1  ORF type:complete len:175 (+),score=28.10 TRINITY_DN10124_c0_g1_i18:638-1162(+)
MELQKLKIEYSKLKEASDSAAEVLQMNIKDIEELTKKNTSLLSHITSSHPLPAEFSLPENEYTIYYCSSQYLDYSGFIYVTPNYLCWCSYTWTGSKLPPLILSLDKIISLNKITGSLRNHVLEISYPSMDLISFKNLYSRHDLCTNIVEQSVMIGHVILLLRDGTTENEEWFLM